MHVRFYDGIDQMLSENEYSILITEDKFKEYATERIKFEKTRPNQVIVGLNRKTQTYLLGIIIKRIESGHEYIIDWCDKTESNQSEEHLFGAFTRRNQHQINDRVLAFDNQQCIYKSAVVINHLNDGKMLTVRFTDPNEENR